MAKAMRTWGFVTVLALLGGPVAAAEGDLSLFLGQNTLHEDPLDASGVGSPFEVGLLLNLDFQWPVTVALDVLHTSEDTDQVIPAEFPLSFATEVETLDLHAGVRYFFRKDTDWQPYLGGGVAWTSLDVKQVESGSFGPGTEYQTLVVDDGESGVGYWAGVGLQYKVNAVRLGADVRYTDVSVDVQPAGATESLELDAGGLHAGVFVGWSW